MKASEKKKKLMILGAGILQLPAIEKAKEMGLETIVVDMDPKAVGFEVADVSLNISTIDIPKVSEAARKLKIDGIITVASDMPMRTVAAVSEELGLVGVGADTAVKTTDKFEMRKALRDYGVPIPRFVKVNDIEDLKEAVNAFSAPIIVKPADSSGSRGVNVLDPTATNSEFEEAYAYAARFSGSGAVMAEEFMRGEEVSVETLSVKGECHVIQITDKLTTGAPHFVETGHTQPTGHSEEIVNAIKKAAVDANRAVGIIDGPSHTEMIVTEDGPKIVEIGARLGGDCITTHLVPYSTGVDMVECCIKIALGGTPDVSEKFEKASAIRYFDSKAGRITKIRGIEDALQTEGIKQISFVRHEGDEVGEIKSSVDRIGFVISQSETAADAVKACEEALKKISIVID